MTQAESQSIPLDLAWQQAITHHQAGQLANAEPLYRAILNVQPNHPDANHNLGILIVQSGRIPDSIPFFQTALLANPRNLQYWISYINALIDSQQFSLADSTLGQARQNGLDEIMWHALKNRLETAALRSGSHFSKNAPQNAKPSQNAQAQALRGNAFQSAGQLSEAEACYRKALKLNPRFVEALANLGVTLQRQGRLEEAENCYRQALAIQPDFAEIHYNLGFTLQNQNKPEEARKCYQKAIKIRANFFEARFNIGVIHQDLGQLDEAETCYRQTIEINPAYAEAHASLGAILQKKLRFEEAEACARQAIALKPDFAQGHNNLGAALQARSRFNEAETCFRQALSIQPNFCEAHYNLANLLIELGRLEEAETHHRQALALNPGFAEAHYNLGILLQAQGQLEAAEQSYLSAQNLGFATARIRSALMLPAIMGTRQELLERRATFERNLDALITDRVPIDDPLKNGWHSNFYLAYHGFNDRDIQIKVAQFYAQACPSLLFSSPHCLSPQPRDPEAPIRVGFLSKYLYNHSISVSYRKIIHDLALNPQFSVYLISNRPIDTALYSSPSISQLHVPENLSLAQQQIANLQLDVLIYLDIGMEPFSYFLAFSRLAPVQCLLGGHPVTSGIPSIDYYLSVDYAEPDNAQDHYSEKLVRLPAAPFFFEKPTIPNSFKSRSDMGLPENKNLYLCPMKLQKIHPDFDDAIQQILLLDPNAVIVFFEDHLFSSWKTLLLQRFHKTISPELVHRIRFLPWIANPDDFLSANAFANVIIDPFHFGIGSTIISAFAVGTPVVTLPGTFLRGRVGFGFCSLMNLHECIAKNPQHFAQIACNIANNPSLRLEIHNKILNNNHLLFNNSQSIQHLAQFIKKTITETQSRSSCGGSGFSDSWIS